MPTATQKEFVFEDLAAAVDQYEERYGADITSQKYFGFPLKPVLEVEQRLLSTDVKSVAYFSMEFGLAPSIYNSFERKKKISGQNTFFTHEVFSNNWLCDYLFKIKIDKMLDIPIYGGGLGVLAGDVIKSAADLNYPLVGIGVLWNKGYFKQRFWYKHGQIPEELTWDPHTYPGLIPLKNIVTIDTKEGPLHLRLWKYYVYSHDKKSACPLILLDSNLPENSPEFRRLTDQLYRSDGDWWKIFQRVILGLGGMKALKDLGYHIDCYHLNEGHAAFALLEQYLDSGGHDGEALREKFMFTCHTPVAAGHDRFQTGDVAKILTDDYLSAAEMFGREDPKGQQINLTYMSLNTCNKVNAVAAKHGEVMRLQFPNYAPKVDSITNGVHLHTWISQPFTELFDRHKKVFGDWRNSPENLCEIEQLKGNRGFREGLFLAHQANKKNLMDVVRHWKLDENVLTLCWARRIAGYKRPALIFRNASRIIDLAEKFGPIQIILAGKAHPNDNIGSAHIDEILDHIDELNDYKDKVKVLILENYDTFFGKLLTNSVDIWLNNPLPPFEASGTSGMKAIINGVPQLTTLDGWVVEAAEDDIGWIFGYRHKGSDLGKETQLRLDEDSDALYNTLGEVAKLYYQTNRQGDIDLKSPWIDKMINCIRRAAFFNTHRMLKEYNDKMWKL